MINDIKTLLKSKYPSFDVVAKINEGGYKQVYKVKVNDQFEALKINRCFENDGTPIKTSEELLARAILEVNLLKNFNHPNIIKRGIIEPFHFKVKEQHYIVYSEVFVEGVSLRNFINTTQKPTKNDVAKVLLDIISAIEYLNNLGFIHRDIKPDNIMKLEGKSEFVLVDFGTIFNIKNTSPITTSMPPMTILYASPESLTHNYKDNVTYLSDLYSLALSIYEFASSIYPFSKSSLTIIHEINNVLPKPIESIRADLAGGISDVINTLLNKQPHDRYGRFSNLKNILEQELI
ncbi:Serine/threonine protein kinase [Parelusimicrobium proximum]|uniref:serine/threonine-protein kinase n=1 Tax=Parelusimicrobium proximum TaxID=3228953 RepID=UPI003D162D20